MNNITNIISKYIYYLIALFIILIISFLMVGKFNGRKKADMEFSEQKRQELLKTKVVNTLTDVNSIVQELAFIKQLENAENNNLENRSIDLHFNPIIEKLENDQLAIFFQEIKIPSPAVYSIEDSKYGYPVSLNYRFLISNENSIVGKKLNVTYSKDTIIEFDFYTLLLKTFINSDLANKKINQYEREIALYNKKKKREQVEIEKRQKAIEKKQRAEEKIRVERLEKESQPKKTTGVFRKVCQVFFAVHCLGADWLKRNAQQR